MKRKKEKYKETKAVKIDEVEFDDINVGDVLIDGNGDFWVIYKTGKTFLHEHKYIEGRCLDKNGREHENRRYKHQLRNVFILRSIIVSYKRR